MNRISGSSSSHASTQSVPPPTARVVRHHAERVHDDEAVRAIECQKGSGVLDSARNIPNHHQKDFEKIEFFEKLRIFSDFSVQDV